MNIIFLCPYATYSHLNWIKSYRTFSTHNILYYSLPGRHWKWRMHGAAITLARQIQHHPEKIDLVVANDMLDMPTFMALTERKLKNIPMVTFFHENQITYPWAPGDKDVSRGRDLHYGFKNITSALTADKVYFNSIFHMNDFLKGADKLLKMMPDFQENQIIDQIKEKSKVLYMGIDFSLKINRPVDRSNGPVILWNHRWEYDKNPEEFFQALFKINEKNIPFKLCVMGKKSNTFPEIFNEAESKLKNNIIQFGKVDSRDKYISWLNKCDIMPITSNHDFFGVSCLEGCVGGAIPLLPKRLAFLEHFPNELRDEIYYDDFNDLVFKLENLLTNWNTFKEKVDYAYYLKKYDWKIIAKNYDQEFYRLITTRNTNVP